MLAITQTRPMQGDGPKPFSTAIPVPGYSLAGVWYILLRVVVTSIVLALLGVMYILVNPNDPGMRGFGWFLVVLGSIIAAVFTYIWVRREMTGDGALSDAQEPQGGSRRDRRGRRS